jgi:hypothetical protein
MTHRSLVFAHTMLFPTLSKSLLLESVRLSSSTNRFFASIMANCAICMMVLDGEEERCPAV